MAVAEDKSHTLINNEANLAGDNLLTIDNPIGDKLNSPILNTKYKVVPEGQRAAVARLRALEMENRRVLARYLGKK